MSLSPTQLRSFGQASGIAGFIGALASAVSAVGPVTAADFEGVQHIDPSYRETYVEDYTSVLDALADWVEGAREFLAAAA